MKQEKEKHFQALLKDHAHSRRLISRQSPTSMLFQTEFSYEDEDETEDTSFLSLYACGKISCEMPFEFLFDSMDCSLLIHTKSGGGRFFLESRHMIDSDTKKGAVSQGSRSEWACHDMTAGSVTLLSCRQKFRLASFLLPWDFKIFWIRPGGFGGYQAFLGTDSFHSYVPDEYSPILPQLLKLCVLPARITEPSRLTMHRLLTDVLCELIASDNSSDNSSAASQYSYLAQLKHDLDSNYAEPFSLEKYENRFKISRYRLCREFSAAYGQPPMRYLKTVRIEKAENMLVTGTMAICDISRAVGYDNVNNFICHFKEMTGMTPGAYRHSAR